MIAVIGGTGFSWEEVPLEELTLLEHGHEEREATENHFAEMIRMTITGVRQSDPTHTTFIPLLITSLRDVEEPRKYHGFGIWNTRIGKVLGVDRCRVIGARVIRDMQFTLLEALELYEKHPQEGTIVEFLQ